MKPIKLTATEIYVLKMILGVDLDALGLNRKDQKAARSALKKLWEVGL